MAVERLFLEAPLHDMAALTTHSEEYNADRRGSALGRCRVRTMCTAFRNVQGEFALPLTPERLRHSANRRRGPIREETETLIELPTERSSHRAHGLGAISKGRLDSCRASHSADRSNIGPMNDLSLQ
jgi:hypothetical protein